MNFKSLLFLSSLLFFNSCGVKSDPVPPPGTSLPSIPNEYLYIAPEKPKPQEEVVDEEESSEQEETSKKAQ